MEVNINSKRKPYEVGDLVEISGFGFRMIIKNNRKLFQEWLNGKYKK